MSYLTILFGIVAGVLTVLLSTDKTPLIVTNILLAVILGQMLNRENPKKQQV